MSSMVEERVLEMTLISASNLKDVNFISKMETYVVLNFPPYFEYTSQVDSKGGVNPHWGEKFGFMLPESLLQRGESRMKIEIYTLSTLGPKFVGEINIPLSDISTSARYNQTQYKRYPVKIASGDFHGELLISFNLGDKVIAKSDKAHDYPITRPPIPKPVNHQEPHASSLSNKVPTKPQTVEPYSQKPTKPFSSYNEPSYPSSLSTPVNEPSNAPKPTKPNNELSYPSRTTKLVSPNEEFPYPSKPSKPLSYYDESPYLPKPFKTPYEDYAYPLKPSNSFSSPVPPQHVTAYPSTTVVNKVPIPSLAQPITHTMMKPHQTYIGSTLPITSTRIPYESNNINGAPPSRSYGSPNTIFASPLGKILLTDLSKSMIY